MRRVAVVQARTGSTRLPGKVLAEVAGKPMLAQLLRRLGRSRLVDEVVVATTRARKDDAIEALANNLGLRVVRGDATNVLSRYVQAQRATGADVIVRITADCPLVDPEIVDRVVATLQAANADYASNLDPRTYPQGLDVEAFTAVAVAQMQRLARTADDFEHVTWVVRFNRPDAFTVVSVTDDVDNSDLRWTVDTADDLELIRILYRELAIGETDVGYREVLRHVRAHRHLARLNVLDHYGNLATSHRRVTIQKERT